MNHRPFEDWLLDDQPLTPGQTRELQAHLRICTSCAALAESNLALESVRLVAPAEGFALRFQERLAESRKTAHLRQAIGALVLVIGGLGFLYGLLSPMLFEILGSPAEWITTVVAYLLYAIATVRVWTEVFMILFGVLPDFISPFGLLIGLSMIGSLSLLWTLSLWRFSRLPQGV